MSLMVSDVFARVKRTFGDESGVQLTEDDIIRFINDAQREAVMQNEGLLPTVVYLDAVTNQRRYAVPSSLFSIQHVYFQSYGSNQYYKLKWLTTFEFSVFIDGWDGSPDSDFPRVFTKETNEIILFPLPNQNVAKGIKLHAARYAADVSQSSDALDVPPWLHTMVVNYCLSQAYEMDEDWEASQIKAQQVQGDLDFNSHRDAWFGRDTYPTVTERFEPFSEWWG